MGFGLERIGVEWFFFLLLGFGIFYWFRRMELFIGFWEDRELIVRIGRGCCSSRFSFMGWFF